MIYFLLILVIICFLIERYAAAAALKHMKFSCVPEDYLVEPEHEFNLVFTVHNNSRIPVFYMKIKSSVPENIIIADNQPGKLDIYGSLSEYTLTTFLMPGQQKELRVKMKLMNRGIYRFSKYSISVGDFLGISSKTIEIPGSSDLVILPEKLNSLNADYITGGLIGEHSINRWIHEDPILTVGFRDYTGHEPQKAISWNRSLQSQRLMVKQFDHTTDRKVSVILWTDNDGDERIEYSLSLCRTICDYLNDESVPFSLYHSGCLYTSMGSLADIRTGLGGVHLNRIYEALGRASFFETSVDFDTLSWRIINTEYESNCFIVITSKNDSSFSAKMQRLANRMGSNLIMLSYDNREVIA